MKFETNQDFKTHAVACDRLLQHYTQQFRDRECYWVSREFSRSHEGLLCVIIDSYDKSKLSLPRWPFNRVPKKSLYEETRRISAVSETFQDTLIWVNLFSCFQVGWNVSNKLWGTYLTLTCVICHGWGCFIYLSNEALTEGSNWNWECVSWKHFSASCLGNVVFVSICTGHGNGHV